MVAIIAILAAIAVPNFLEAQTRSKVSRAKADMRTLATAIEAYQVDANVYPLFIAPGSPFLGGTSGSGINGPSVFRPQPTVGCISSRFIRLTTPISYLTSVFRDPFIPESIGRALSPTAPFAANDEYDTYDYVESKSVSPGGRLGGTRGASITSGAAWHVVSAGPDKINAFGGGHTGQNVGWANLGVDYDPTNGTISSGDIVRIGSSPGPLPGTERPRIDRVQNRYNNLPW